MQEKKLLDMNEGGGEEGESGETVVELVRRETFNENSKCNPSFQKKKKKKNQVYQNS